MTRPIVALCAAALAVTAVARTASAAVCVELDPARDNLADQDRGALLTLLAQTLQQQGQEVSNQNCMGIYRVYHVRLGNSVTVFMQGPQGYRQATARALEDVPALYSQMVRSLLTGQPMAGSNATVDRSNVTSSQQAPNRVEADSLWYARLGYAGTLGPVFRSGPAIGFGYRYELDSIGVDLSFINFMFASESNNSGGSGVTGSWIKLMGLYFVNPMANASMYLGGGISWGLTRLDGNGLSYTGNGLQAEASVGFEMLRASTIRLFVQADATAPLYLVRAEMPLTGGTTDGAWAPTVGLSFGIGWGRSIIRVHAVP
jgi:hypothetical protein